MVTICRRCQAPLTVPGSTLRPVAGELVHQGGDVVLCASCSDDFARWLRASELFEALQTGSLLLDPEPFHPGVAAPAGSGRA